MRGRFIAAGVSQVSNANIANLITVVRILVAPLFVWLVVIDDGANSGARWLAGLLFVAAIATDGIDGALARRRNLITNTGILLDPIADKVLIVGALGALWWVGELPLWIVLVIVVRELGITVFRFVVLSDRVIPASRGGKLKTIAQAVTLSSWLIPTWIVLGSWVFVLNWVLMAIVVVLTTWTGIDYLVKGLKAPEKTNER
ncbi:MAG: CDP-diacylglycerol--glycerol-3-phosphate 3-phosphatidyltransferase [Pontimonas sp.]|nr:CDP-diacylglycerol--glycerol-3-phosphate 3-phosphatidyltransferase [Pontimonas sp.]